MKIRTPNDLLAVDLYDETTDVSGLVGCYYNHVPELPEFEEFDEGHSVIIRIYEMSWYDHRRFWQLASVWLKDKPVMIIQNAGREGDDWSRRYIVDVDAYRAMVSNLMAHINQKQHDVENVVDPSEPIQNLIAFYGGCYRSNTYPGSGWERLEHPKNGWPT